MSENERVIGIIGGLGNEAMVDLVMKIKSIHGHERNSYVVYGNSRLAYKPHEVSQEWKPDDEPEIRKRATAIHTAHIMGYLGCGAVGLACNSAHELFREVVADQPFNFVDMIYETARSISESKEKVLVLGVTSLVESGLYQNALSKYGVEAVKPSPENMNRVMSAIYDTGFGIKTAKITHESEKLLCDVITEEYHKQGVRSAVLGCTELPLALTSESCIRFKGDGLIPGDMKIVDASVVLAESLLKAECSLGTIECECGISPDADVDWFSPAVFIVETLEELVEVQSEVIRMTVNYLGTKGLKLEGSYMHLPTLFAVGNPPAFSNRVRSLSDRIIDVRSDWKPLLTGIIKEHFRSMSNCLPR